MGRCQQPTVLLSMPFKSHRKLSEAGELLQKEPQYSERWWLQVVASLQRYSQQSLRHCLHSRLPQQRRRLQVSPLDSSLSFLLLWPIEWWGSGFLNISDLPPSRTLESQWNMLSFLRFIEHLLHVRHWGYNNKLWTLPYKSPRSRRCV